MPRTTKKPAKPAKKPATGRPFKKGDARINRTVAGPGRTPDEFKQMCRGLATRDETLRAVEAILENPDHGAYIGALKWASEHGYGRPGQSIELTGKDGGPVVVDRVLRWGTTEIPL